MEEKTNRERAVKAQETGLEDNKDTVAQPVESVTYDAKPNRVNSTWDRAHSIPEVSFNECERCGFIQLSKHGDAFRYLIHCNVHMTFHYVDESESIGLNRLLDMPLKELITIAKQNGIKIKPSTGRIHLAVTIHQGLEELKWKS